MRSDLIIIGGAGFLGRHLSARAAMAGIRCTLVAREIDPVWRDRFGEGHDVLDRAGFAGEAGDRAIGEARAIVWLAGRTTPSSSAARPARELDDNLKPAFDTFDRISRLNPAARIILASSGGTVYGDTRISPIPETHPAAPLSAYGLGKLLVEQALGFFAVARGQRTAILRISNLVGEHFRPRFTGLVGAALRAALDGVPVPVFGDGLNVRDFVDADDASDAILGIVAATDRLDGSCLWNLGSGQGHSVLDVLTLVAEATGRRVAIDWQPARPFDARGIVLDVSRIAGDLGWRAATSLPATVDRMLAAMARREGQRTAQPAA